MDEDGLQSGFFDCKMRMIIQILPSSLCHELTTSYGHGTINGPKSCIEASWQVELFDDKLEDKIPAGFKIHTAPFWKQIMVLSQANWMKLLNLQRTGINIMPSLFLSVESMVFYHQWFEDLGGYHRHPNRCTCDFARNLTEKYFMQWQRGQWTALLPFSGGHKAYSKEEFERIKKDENIHTWFV